MTISESVNQQSPDSSVGLEQRHWPFDGAFNVRDVGGYPTADGHHTRWRTLWRSDSLHRLTQADQRKLLDAGLHTVIDLRFAQEASRAPDVFATAPGVIYYNIELLPGAISAGAMPTMPTGLSEVYQTLIDHCQSAIRETIAIAADDASGPLLVHCTLGKDRTGVITALLLSAVGVPDEVIVEDYALTSQYVESLLPALRAQAVLDKRDMAIYDMMLRCEPEYIADLLRYVQDHYGTIINYLHTIGISDDQLAHLRAWLVD